MLATPEWISAQETWAANPSGPEPAFVLSDAARNVLPTTADLYGAFARFIQTEDSDSPMEEDPWVPVYPALYQDLIANPDAASAYSGETATLVGQASAAAHNFDTVRIKELFFDPDDDWGHAENWAVIQTFAPKITSWPFNSAHKAP